MAGTTDDDAPKKWKSIDPDEMTNISNRSGSSAKKKRGATRSSDASRVSTGSSKAKKAVKKHPAVNGGSSTPTVVKKKVPEKTASKTPQKVPASPGRPVKKKAPSVKKKIPASRPSMPDGRAASTKMLRKGSSNMDINRSKSMDSDRVGPGPKHVGREQAPKSMRSNSQTGGRHANLDSLHDTNASVIKEMQRQNSRRGMKSNSLDGSSRKENSVPRSSPNLMGRKRQSSLNNDDDDGMNFQVPQSMKNFGSQAGNLLRSSIETVKGLHPGGERDGKEGGADDGMRVPLPQSMANLFRPKQQPEKTPGPGPNSGALQRAASMGSPNGQRRSVGVRYGDPPPLSKSAVGPPGRSKSGGGLSEMRQSVMRRNEGLTRAQSMKSGPQSILRNSSHHDRRPKSDPARTNNTNVNTVSIQERSEHFSDSDSDLEEESIKFDSGPRPTLRKTHLSKGSMDISGHSMNYSWHTTRSMLTVEEPKEFEDDTCFKRVLRYIRILPPHPNEKPYKKKIRIFVWCTLILDFVAAMVSITTYKGITTCCEVPIFDFAGGGINWDETVRITTYVYLALVFAEVIPVVRRGLPFNLVNPVVGFSITFFMFFDDRIVEAVCMWILEAMAIFFEFLVYCLKSKTFNKRNARLEKLDKDLSAIRKLQKSRGSAASDFSDEDSCSGNSFGDEEFNSSDSGLGGSTHLRENRLLRERRVLRQSQATERLSLRYHLIGVSINFGLIVISLILIIAIAQNGGLCVTHDQRPVVFDPDQISRCPACKTETGKCEKCNLDGPGTAQCYFPYGD